MLSTDTMIEPLYPASMIPRELDIRRGVFEIEERGTRKYEYCSGFPGFFQASHLIPRLMSLVSLGPTLTSSIKRGLCHYHPHDRLNGLCRRTLQFHSRV